MRTERGAALTKHPIAVVSLLAFLVGGAAAVMLNYPPRHAVASRQVAETPAAPATQPAGVESAEEGTTSDDFDDSAAPTEETGGEAEDSFEESDAEAENRSGGVRRRRPATNVQAVQSPPAPRQYAAVSRRQSNPGGRVAGYTVGGVKKTGQGVKKAGTTIGRTFGKIGGVFND